MSPKKRILVVDDESDTLSTLKDLLEDEGYDVTLAEDGKRGLDILGRWRPDVVVCDLRMPEMGGMEFLERVKKIAPDQKFVFLSAYADWTSYIEGLVRGAYDMLRKPCPNRDLLHTIREVLESREVAH